MSNLTPEQAAQRFALRQKINQGTATPADVVALHDHYVMAGEMMHAAIVLRSNPLAVRAAEAEGLRPMQVSACFDQRRALMDVAGGIRQGMAHAQDATLGRTVSLSQDASAAGAKPEPSPFDKWQAMKASQPLHAAAFYQMNRAAIVESWPSDGGEAA